MYSVEKLENRHYLKFFSIQFWRKLRPFERYRTKLLIAPLKNSNYLQKPKSRSKTE